MEGAGLRFLAKIVRGSLTMEVTFEQRLGRTRGLDTHTKRPEKQNASMCRNQNVFISVSFFPGA